MTAQDTTRLGRCGQLWTNHELSHSSLSYDDTHPHRPIKLSVTNHCNSATILAAVIGNICCLSSEHFQTRAEAALVDTVYTDMYGTKMLPLTKKKKCAILLSILVLLRLQRCRHHRMGKLWSLHNSIFVWVSLPSRRRGKAIPATW